MIDRRAKLLTRTLAVLGLVLVAVTLALSVGDRTSDTGDLPFIVLMGPGMMGFAAIGLVIAARAPSNPIGWLYAAVGLCAIIGITADQYATRGLTDLDLPGAGYAAWVSGVVVPLMFSSLLLALLLFPTGSPPSRRWRIAGWLITGGGILAVVGSGDRDLAGATQRLARILRGRRRRRVRPVGDEPRLGPARHGRPHRCHRRFVRCRERARERDHGAR